jgi:hypothetical protein
MRGFRRRLAWRGLQESPESIRLLCAVLVEDVVIWWGYKLQVLRFEIRSDVYKLDNFGAGICGAAVDGEPVG